jgi:hypothetical protein
LVIGIGGGCEDAETPAAALCFGLLHWFAAPCGKTLALPMAGELAADPRKWLLGAGMADTGPLGVPPPSTGVEGHAGPMGVVEAHDMCSGLLRTAGVAWEGMACSAARGLAAQAPVGPEGGADAASVRAGASLV